MKEQYYEAIFKRKSFHLFRNVGADRISPEELESIEKAYANFEALYPDIRTAIRVVPARSASCRRPPHPTSTVSTSAFTSAFWRSACKTAESHTKELSFRITAETPS